MEWMDMDGSSGLVWMEGTGMECIDGLTCLSLQRTRRRVPANYFIPASLLH